MKQVSRNASRGPAGAEAGAPDAALNVRFCQTLHRTLEVTSKADEMLVLTPHEPYHGATRASRAHRLQVGSSTGSPTNVENESGAALLTTPGVTSKKADASTARTPRRRGFAMAVFTGLALFTATILIPTGTAVDDELFVPVAEQVPIDLDLSFFPGSMEQEILAPVVTPPPAVTTDEAVEKALGKRIPEDLADLIAIEKRVKEIAERVIPATVFLSVQGTLGSGVIVSEDGLVLTAGHVTGGPGKRVRVRLSDGKQLMGRSLGVHQKYDMGVLKIDGDGPHPFVDICPEDDYGSGDWCLALGHPGGYQRNRPPVVRLGRVVSLDRQLMRTDCPLIGGDSGGPLVDLEGRVIAIHSRIQPDITYNFHVPGERFREFWTDLVGGVELPPVIGILGNDHSRGCLVREVTPDLPAMKAGIREDDIIRTIDGRRVRGIDGLKDLLSDKRVGDEVTIEVLRGDESMKKTITLARRPLDSE